MKKKKHISKGWDVETTISPVVIPKDMDLLRGYVAPKGDPYDCEKISDSIFDEHPKYQAIEKSMDEQIDELEYKMMNYPLVDCKVEHFFILGFYIRKIVMPASKEKKTMVTSLIHKTTHPFYIKKGKVSIFSENAGSQLLESGHWGMTTPNTRRVLLVHKPTEWITFHAISWITGEENSLTNAEKEKIVGRIGDEIIESHENILLGGAIKNNIITKNITI